MKAVCDTMDVLEIFTISRASERAERVLKLFLSRRNIELTALFAETFILEGHNRKHTENIAEFVTFFKICKVSLVFERPQLASAVIQLIRSFDLTIDSFDLNLENGYKEQYHEMIELSREAKNLDIISDPTKKFRLSISANPSQFNSLRLVHAKWVTRYYLTNLFINCKELYMENCQLKYSDYLMFFKQWIKESRLEVAKIKMKEQRNFSALFKQLKATPVNRRLDIPDCFCYMIQQEITWIRAIVLFTPPDNLVNLTTEFEL
ncbi:hypothetical protein GCK72_022736 [Caenorhabditis remanei]|uniref:Sdz-33 F-box domain-containing protein n=1 Tax=Caenorhabditis remanei TaxID=31234 RepID=A0A6A5FUR9_CAERE|nr:hypothetical protein GCK72_022736 [Caenorhabditis remanei]KAF1746283.1 hypothetical protein GCK72_022736 [Caenorhabditis remanei]